MLTLSNTFASGDNLGYSSDSIVIVVVVLLLLILLLLQLLLFPINHVEQ